MTLQNKTLLVIGATFIGLIVVLYAASQVIVLGSFSDEERVEAVQNVGRVQSALADNLTSLEATTRDWATWDDSYEFVRDGNQAFIDSNLNDSNTMMGSRLNLMLFVNLRGEVVFEKGFDYHEEINLPRIKGLQEHIYADSPLLHHTSSVSSIKGVLVLPDGPMLIASEPVLPSSGAGSIGGTLIFGRFLDEVEIKHLSKATFLTLTFQPVEAEKMPPGFAEVKTTLMGAGSPWSAIEVHPEDASTIAGYTLISDVYGKPAVILKAEMPRDIFMRGQETVRYFMFALVVVGLVFGVVTVLFMRTLILSRVGRLNKDTTMIAASGDMSGRVNAAGSDELAHLGSSMNNMLEALQRSHEELKEGEERYRAVVEQTTEAIFLVDVETRRFVQANAASRTLFGYSMDELRKITLDDVTMPNSEQTTSHLQSTTGSLRLSTERRYICKDGTVVPVEVTDSHITYGGRDVLCVVARDITDRKRAEIVLRELAMRDGLTGLYNRREMQRILKEAVERYQRFEESTALILLDLDHFKSVNDTYGHQVGDDVLRWTSKVLQEMKGERDKVARFGGEELAIIMSGSGVNEAVELAERIRRALAAQPFVFAQGAEGSEEKVLVPITVSLGVAVLNEHVETAQALVEAADQALYEAKRSGRDCTRAYRTLSSELSTLG
jgi:diguanylate cyclase (GGDEF)-like protein/PAS domain S-box-containing protein